MKKINYAKLSILLIVIAAILRFSFALAHHAAGDACWHLSAARFIAEENRVPLFEGLGRAQPFWAPPLFHFIAAFFYKIFMGISLDLADLGSKLVSPIFGTLTVIVLYLIARKLFDEEIAFYSLIFINFFPLFIEYSVVSFVESTVAFFSILSIYLVINNRHLLASISLGLASLSKYNALFIFPAVIYLAYRVGKAKGRLNRVLVIAFVPLIVSSIWFVRNFILLKNPVWPFLNNVFHGVDIGTSFSTISLEPLFSLATYTNFYLEAFGVPSGNIQFLYTLNFPFLKLFLYAWLIGTLIFIYPLIKGFFSISDNIKAKYFFHGVCIAFLSFLFMFVIYLMNVGWFVARLMLPVIPLAAIIWAAGLKSVKMKEIYMLILLLVCLGFIVVGGIRFYVAASEWNKYAEDFEWVKKNTKQDALFFGNGQCLAYNINRIAFSDNSNVDLNEVDYIWVNNKWKIDFQMEEEPLRKVKSLKGLSAVYNNAETGTVVYSIR